MGLGTPAPALAQSGQLRVRPGALGCREEQGAKVLTPSQADEGDRREEVGFGVLAC